MMLEKIITGSNDNEPKECECQKDAQKMIESADCLEMMRQMASDIHTMCMIMQHQNENAKESTETEDTEDVITFNQRR